MDENGRDGLEGRDPLEACLDGDLSDEERARFEEQLSADDARAVEQQQRIDAALRGRFAPPPPERARVIVAAAQASSERKPLGRRAMLRIAAGLAAAVIGGWLIWANLPTKNDYDRNWRSPGDIFHLAVDNDLTPDWRCETDQEFADTFWNLLGQRLLFRGEETVRAMGLSRRRSMSSHTVVFLAYVGEDPVVVLVDHVENERFFTPPEDLHWHRSVVGQLVLFEISRMDRPLTLDSFYDPELEGRP